jgi:Oxidoreductase family, NAD-binding Rossmann fold
MKQSRIGEFLRAASGIVLTTAAGRAIAQEVGSGRPNQAVDVQLSQIHAATEEPEKVPGSIEPEDQRTGYAIVGLGRLALGQILPAMGRSKHSKPVALVSGDRVKAMKIATQYGIKQSAIYDYATYDRIAENHEVEAIYIVLPNSMHAESFAVLHRCRHGLLQRMCAGLRTTPHEHYAEVEASMRCANSLSHSLSQFFNAPTAAG